MKALFNLLILLGSFLAGSVSAQVSTDVALDNGETIPVYRGEVALSDQPVVLWLPSHRGLASPLHGVADGLNSLGIEVWLADLHLAYLVDPGRSSVNEFPAEDIAQLVLKMHSEIGRKVVVLGMHRAARNALEAVRELQLSDQSDAIAGVLLFSPALTEPVLRPGQAAPYLPVARSTNVPVYVVQAGISTRQWRVQELLGVLQSGGSQAFVKVLKGIQAGYLMRSEDDLTVRDLEARADAPFLIQEAISLLSKMKVPEHAVNLSSSKVVARESLDRYGLKFLSGDLPSSLELPDLNGQLSSLTDYHDKVFIVSFWASWCEPCIRELPSMARLYSSFSSRGLEVIAVNVGEDIRTINAIVKDFDMQRYKLLRDVDGREMKRWNVYGFPTNFVVGRDGTFRYGSFGAVDWDDESVRRLVENVL